MTKLQGVPRGRQTEGNATKTRKTEPTRSMVAPQLFFNELEGFETRSRPCFLKYTVPLATPKSLFDIRLRTRKLMGTFFSYHTSSYRAAMKRSSKKNAVLGWAAVVESVSHGLRKEFVWTSHKPQSATTRSESAVSHTTPDRGVRTGRSYL